jgi:prepilin-type N-terminal cleavage/methylation domain-containing protein
MTHRTHCRRRAFTLTELLVVIGIVVALAALGLPMALRSYRSAIKARTLSDLAAIAAGLNAYKQDFGDYPRVLTKDPLVSNGPGWNIGGAILCKALIGPYGDRIISNGVVDPQDPPSRASLSDIKSGQCISDAGGYIALVDDPASSPPNSNPPFEWAPFVASDGKDGVGFRLRQQPLQEAQGQAYGPYLQPDKFNVIGCMMHDREGNPILYFPAAPGAHNIRGNVADGTTQVPGYVWKSQRSLYDVRDGVGLFTRAAEASDQNGTWAIQIMLGDMDHDGLIDAGETPATEAPFILWTAGADGLFGPVRGTGWTPTKRDVDKCDDVISFQQ